MVPERLAVRTGTSKIEGRQADVRDRDRILICSPNTSRVLVFHAAALKHVPLLEHDWTEGIKTNIFGSINVAADATVACSRGNGTIFGPTRRSIWSRCWALPNASPKCIAANSDADFSGRPRGDSNPIRIAAVRFGNVLASNGSVAEI